MKLLNYITIALKTLTFLCFAGLVAAVTMQILGRFLPIGFVWTEEVSRYLFIFSVALGAPLTMERREFVRVDIVLFLMPDRFKKIYDAVIYAVIGAFSILLMFIAYDFALIGQNRMSATLPLSMMYIHGIMLVSFFLLAMYSLLNIFAILKGKDVEEEKIV
jgi:TRAP-type transport system small permease protein